MPKPKKRRHARKKKKSPAAKLVSDIRNLPLLHKLIILLVGTVLLDIALTNHINGRMEGTQGQLNGMQGQLDGMQSQIDFVWQAMGGAVDRSIWEGPANPDSS